MSISKVQYEKQSIFQIVCVIRIYYEAKNNKIYVCLMQY